MSWASYVDDTWSRLEWFSIEMQKWECSRIGSKGELGWRSVTDRANSISRVGGGWGKWGLGKSVSCCVTIIGYEGAGVSVSQLL